MTREKLYADLKTPPLGAISIQDALELWHYTRFEITCLRPEHFEEMPDLAARLRGAMGQILFEKQARQMPFSKRETLRAYVIFYTPLLVVGRDEVPHPFVIRTKIEKNEIKIELRLFGFASFWGDEMADALVEALEKGIALKQNGRLRVPFQIQHILQQKTSHLDATTPRHYAKLRFKTPLALRQNATVSLSCPALLAAIERRLHALMPWQGFLLTSRLPLLTFKTQEMAMQKMEWQRYSINQGDNPIPMQGFLGELTLEGELAPLAPWLNLAETTNIGSHTALGLGWFELIGF